MTGDTAQRSSSLPILAVFTENAMDREYLRWSLNGYFAHYLNIVPLNIETAGELTTPPRAVVVNTTSHKIAQDFFPDSQVIYAERFVNSPQLEQLVELPEGTRVLVVNHPEEIAVQTRNDLLSLGINHVELVPYWPGSSLDTSGIEHVLYAGFRYYCPGNKSCYIDIGYRSISQATLGEVIKIYDLPTDCLNRHFVTHVKSIVEGLYRTRHMLDKTESLRHNLEQVNILSSNGLITVDSEGKILVCNPAAEQIMGLSAEGLVGSRYEDVFRSFDQLLGVIREGKEVADELIYIRKLPVLATSKIIQAEKNPRFFISLSPVEALQGTVEKARTSMYKRGFTAKYRFEHILGESQSIRDAVALAECYARHQAPVLICGESGTGKELFAQAIHNHSSRAAGPFVAVNFAAIAETLIESELFGYEEGAFTGASKGGKQGLFRLAHKGTIFLDEIGDISPTMQSRLLRVLEEQEIMPVGSTKVIPIDVRLIYATNKNLLAMIREGRFREDLYYRLKVFTLDVPPLRKRREDIPVILDALLGTGCCREKLAPALLDKMYTYDWPGNIRELKSLAQYLSMLTGPDGLAGPGGLAGPNGLGGLGGPNGLAGLAGSSGPGAPGGLAGLSRSSDALFKGLGRVIDSFFDVEQPARPQALGKVISNNVSPESLSPESLGEEDRAILRCIHALNQARQPAGRYSLVRQPDLLPYAPTEARMKSRLKCLEAKGFLISGKTRQGVCLSPAGLSAISS